ncbi:MAG: GHKL domain-containing protein [Clostridium sp.]|nr:GHKL domain-containing protein [Acetatifactor muris]MCM1528014.1 GHKL domain-containing protein [Bacteroides sp.]MCM1563097.1 GHKL domain-containing protein [Clostridium sp.]
MFDVITALSTNLFRTFIVKRFISVFFSVKEENRGRERNYYLLFFFVTTGFYLAFHFPPITIMANLITMFIITQAYEGETGKKLLAVILIYGVNMACDIVSIYSFSNYTVGGGYNEIAAYVTVFLISICEILVEKVIIKNKKTAFSPPYVNLLIAIPVISIAILFVLMMNNLNNRAILVLTGAGILFINILIFYLYGALLDVCLKLEENHLFERQIAGYANQLDLLMQSEERVTALRHDMKHHLNELLIKANNGERDEIITYIQDMGIFMENSNEYSRSGNKEVDSLLNYMLNNAEKVLNKIEYKISIPKDLGIRLFDINIILGNLLENAISAAGNSEEKWLSVFIKYEKGILFIHIMNSYSGQIIRQGTHYVTTKKETQGHGIGLQNVKKIVDSYHGTLDVEHKNNIFDVKIMIYTVSLK